MFTYEDFEKKWTDAGVNLSDADQALARSDPDAGVALIQTKTDYKNATTDAARAMAHAKAESIRSQYGGYQGGSSGGGYYKSDAADAGSKAYDSTVEGLTKQITDRPAFSYDPKTDPVYQNMLKGYQRESDRATENTLAKFAAMTGGRPSSAAATAAAQQGNYYASAMADKQLDARAQALSEYQSALSGDVTKLNAASGIQQGAKNQVGTNLDNAAQGIQNTVNQVNTLLNLKDYGALAKMGYDVTVLQAIEKDTRAANLLSLGDFDALDKLGYNTATIRKNQNMNIIDSLISQHNWDALDAMGVNTAYYRALDVKSLA